MNEAAFDLAVLALEYEILRNPKVGILTVDEGTIVTSLGWIKPYNLNTTDAILLTVTQDFIRQNEVEAMAWLVSSDKRLVRAAEAKGIHTLNPETVTVEEIGSLLAP